MIDDASEEAVAIVEDVALRWLVINGPAFAEPFGLAVRSCFDEERNAASRWDCVVGQAGLEERLQWIAMVVTMDAVELIFNRALELHVVTDAVAASVAFSLASVSSRVLLWFRSLNHQLASAVWQLVLLVFVSRDDVVAILHPLDMRLWRSTNAALQSQQVVMQIVAF